MASGISEDTLLGKLDMVRFRAAQDVGTKRLDAYSECACRRRRREEWCLDRVLRLQAAILVSSQQCGGCERDG